MKLQATVLIVDDDKTMRTILNDLVSQLGYTTAIAENGLSALAIIRKKPPDLVLCDITMPEMDGYEVLGKIKSDPKLREIPVIMISAIDEIDSFIRCIENGADDYLVKPYYPELLKIITVSF